MIYKSPDALEVPHGASVVWRYLPHRRFVDLLRRSSLYFTDAAQLSDQHEVTLPAPSLRAKRRALARTGLKGPQLQHAMSRFTWSRDPDKALTLMNCWSLCPEESFALWKVYLRGEQNGVAIRTTVARLRRSIEKGRDPVSEEFFIGKVRYRTYLADTELTRFHVICTKKPFYAFESELRAFILHYSKAGAARAPYAVATGRHVRVDLKTLLQAVYVSPFAAKDYVGQVRQLCAEAAIATSPRRSSILDQ